MHDTFTLRGYFNNAQISNEYTASQIVDLGIMLLKGKSSSELKQLERTDPAVFEVIERRGGPRARAAGTSSGASSSRSSISASGSSGSS